MIRQVLILAVSAVTVLSQRPIIVTPVPGSATPIVIAKEQCYTSPSSCDRSVVITKTITPNLVMPATYMPEIITPISSNCVPVMKYANEMTCCPELCYEDILNVPLGYLDPILDAYCINTVADSLKLPMDPYLAVSCGCPLPSRSSQLLPPAFECDSYNRCLNREFIPPPFI